MQQGQQLDVDIEKFANRGKALTRVDGFVVFVRGAVPGDRMRIEITNRKKSYAEAEPVRLLHPGDKRTTPRCIYSDTCGGCSWQHATYPTQLELKEQAVRDALQYTGRLSVSDIDLRPTLAADNTYYYRNKVTYTFSTRRSRRNDPEETNSEAEDFALGLHPRGEHDAVLDLRECFLQSPLTERLINELRRFCSKRGWSAWSPETNAGYLRQCIIHMPARTHDVMVHLTTTRSMPDRMEGLSNFIRNAFPSVTTFVHSTVDPTGGATHETNTLFGPGIVREMLCGHAFEIDPHTFFQPNTRQAEKLYHVVREMSALRPEDRLYDLYCGVGSLSLWLAPDVKQVIGIDANRLSVQAAERNARNNDIENCSFVPGAVRQQINHVKQSHGKPDIVICDPPRTGLDRSVVRQLKRLDPDRITYVSCDPQTQARDLKRLGEQYTVEAVQPVDMFPQTYHVETVAKLSSNS